MLEWFKRLLGVTRLEDSFSVQVEDAHVRVDELETAVNNLRNNTDGALLEFAKRLDLLEANVVVHKRPKNYKGGV